MHHKTAAKTKSNVVLEIDVPKKTTFVSSGIECCFIKLDGSSCYTTVVFPNRLYCYYSDFRKLYYVVGCSVIGILSFLFSANVDMSICL